jgi:hypothetical protein
MSIISYLSMPQVRYTTYADIRILGTSGKPGVLLGASYWHDKGFPLGWSEALVPANTCRAPGQVSRAAISGLSDKSAEHRF